MAPRCKVIYQWMGAVIQLSKGTRIKVADQSNSLMEVSTNSNGIYRIGGGYRKFITKTGVQLSRRRKKNLG